MEARYASQGESIALYETEFNEHEKVEPIIISLNCNEWRL
jgi:hypothetical protein